MRYFFVILVVLGVGMGKLGFATMTTPWGGRDPFSSQSVEGAGSPAPLLIKNSKDGMLSVQCQKAPIRTVLKKLAERISVRISVNVLINPEVVGAITLQLSKVSASQAFDIILESHNLAVRKMAHIWYVAPMALMAKQDKLALSLQAQNAQLLPLSSYFYHVQYANAKQLAELLKSSKGSLLGPRGSVLVDARTNTLTVRDTAYRLLDIKAFLKQLDVPVKQIEIEARLVAVDKQGLEDLGLAWHIGGTHSFGEGSQPGPSASHGLGGVGLALASLPSGLVLDMALQALETKGDGKVISSPHLMVANRRKASIEQGQEIPFNTAAGASGATQVQFKKAVLGLSVTPQLAPDGYIILNLDVSNDHVSKNLGAAGNIPIIDTTKVQTQVKVKNGQTVVLGGIYIESHHQGVKRVPFLGSIPGLGLLFQSKHLENEKSEILIFVTPRVVKPS